MYNNSENKIVLTPSLLMRLMEWSHEEAESDISLHRALEKIIAFSDGVNPLNMDCYECIIAEANENGECASDEDLCNAYELGQKQAENGMDLSNDLTKAAGYMITAIKDNGYGASNSEIEQFCQGYNDDNAHIVYTSDFDCTKPTTMELTCGGEECCPQETIEDDLKTQIESIIKAGKF